MNLAKEFLSPSQLYLKTEGSLIGTAKYHHSAQMQALLLSIDLRLATPWHH